MQYTPLKCTCQQDHVSHQYLCRVSEDANVMLNMCRVWHELPTLSMECCIIVVANAESWLNLNCLCQQKYRSLVDKLIEITFHLR